MLSFRWGHVVPVARRSRRNECRGGSAPGSPAHSGSDVRLVVAEPTEPTRGPTLLWRDPQAREEFYAMWPGTRLEGFCFALGSLGVMVLSSCLMFPPASGPRGSAGVRTTSIVAVQGQAISDTELTSELCKKATALRVVLNTERAAVVDLRDGLARMAAATDGPAAIARAAADDSRSLAALTGATGSTGPGGESWLATLLRGCEAL